MIFISHNSLDKPVVTPIAEKLKEIYGMNKVFFDSWSIQPGDGIIEEMNNGLQNCQFFFFFISKNSLKSSMVKLEWQNALMKENRVGIKFIPVLLDNSIIPAILSQKLYIDLYRNGIDIAVRQIIDIINGNNIYRSNNEQFSNLVAYKFRKGRNIIIECCALYYLEPISNFLFLTKNKKEEINFESLDKSMFFSSFIENMKLNNGLICNGCSIGFKENILPKFSQSALFTPKKEIQIDIFEVMHPISKEKYATIPFITKDTN